MRGVEGAKQGQWNGWCGERMVVRRGSWRAKQWPPTGVGVDSGKGVCGGDKN